MVILDVSVVNVALPSIRDGPRLLGRRPAVGGQRLHADLRGLPAARRPRGRPARPPARLRGRAAAVRGSPRWPAACRPARAMLIVARAVQGLGGAVVAPATLAIITTTFAEGYERNRALGYWGAMGAVGGVDGRAARRRADPAAGLAVDPLHQRADRASSASSARMRFIPESTRAAAGERHFDVAGALTRHRRPRAADLRHRAHRRQRLGVGARRSRSPAAGLALLVAFVFIERRAPRAARPAGDLPLAHADRRQPRRLPARLLRCSRCGTSSRSTCSRCSATRRSRPACASCR